MKPEELEELARRVVAAYLESVESGGGVSGGEASSPPGGPEGADGGRSAAGPAPGRSGARGKPLSRYIDHTLLRPTATAAEIDKLCREAREYGFAAVCVNPVWVERCAGELAGSDVAVATVVGFPLGASTSRVKALEAEDAIERGATELDMVAALGKIKEADWAAVEADVRAVVEAVAGRAAVKVILETAALEPMEIVRAAMLCREAGAQYVKTSTGFHPAGGATAEAVALLRLAVGPTVGVKASGGVRTCEDALRMIAAGATRIGTSSGVEIAASCGHVVPQFDPVVHWPGHLPPEPTADR